MAYDDPFSPVTNASAAQPDRTQLEGEWSAFLRNPVVQSSVLSMGLQMMQPVALGQSPTGHVAQSIGAGGESVALSAKQAQTEDALDIKRDSEDRQLDLGEKRLKLSGELGRERNAIARQRASRTGAGLTLNQMLVAGRRDAADMQRAADREAQAIEKMVNDVGAREKDMRPEWKQFKGKNFAEISSALQADPSFQERYRKSARGKFQAPVPTTPDSDDDDDDDEPGGVSTPEPAVPVGRTATNKKTGQKARWNGKAWEYI